MLPGDSLGYESLTALTSSINNHSWLGMLSTYNYKLTPKFDFAGGLDIRSYKGVHYREVYDLLGGDYFRGTTQPGDRYIGAHSNNVILKEGDKVYYHNDGLVRWLGGFGQIEYNHKNISAFLNLTGAHSFYKRIDYFKKKDLVLEDTIFVQAVGVNDTICNYGNQINSTCRNPNHNHYTSNSDEARFAETDWQVFPGFTVKLGANWNITESHNVFFNTGVLSKAPRFQNVFDYDNNLYDLIENEDIRAFEIGYGYRSSKFALNFNAYNTIWENKPESGSYTSDGGDKGNYSVTGLDALHRGIELDCAWEISNAFKYEFLSSIGNWKWTSDDAIFKGYVDQMLDSTYVVNVDGIYVGDSPQTQIGSSIVYNYKIQKNLNGYVRLKGVYFDKFFSDYNPFDLDEEAASEGVEVSNVWQIPGYMLFSLHIGNTMYFENSSLHFKFNVLNLFDNTYINDANNNSSSVPNAENRNSDAESAKVFFGLGRKIITSITYKF